MTCVHELQSVSDKSRLVEETVIRLELDTSPAWILRGQTGGAILFRGLRETHFWILANLSVTGYKYINHDFRFHSRGDNPPSLTAPIGAQRFMGPCTPSISPGFIFLLTGGTESLALLQSVVGEACVRGSGRESSLRATETFCDSWLKSSKKWYI